ncbi:MAG: type II CAAX prenyl endopeptidase Rce1 family protein, partial [Pseudonocardiaceae bacterium]
GVGSVIVERLGWTGLVSSLLPALLCSAIAVPLVLLLRRRWDHRSLAGIGLTGLGESTRAFLLGVGVTLGSAVAVFGIGTAAGWVRWNALDPTALLVFVLANGLVALLLEALPEELSFRGYAWTSLRERHRATVATLLTTVLFLLTPGASLVVLAVITTALGAQPSPLGIAPPGEDPVSYLLLLTVFGLTLVAARTATSSTSLWTCIGTHLTFLTVNRIVLSGEQRAAGWSAEFTTPYVVFLVPAYLVLSAFTYVVLGRLHRRQDTRSNLTAQRRKQGQAMSASGHSPG